MAANQSFPIERFSGFESLEQSLFYQEKLKKNTFESYQLRGVEDFPPNEYYGLDLIVKNFMELSPKKSLKFGLMHGVTFGYQHNCFLYRRRERIPIFTFTNQIDQEILRYLRTPRAAFQLPHLFTLLATIFKANPSVGENSLRKQFIFFPPHSNQTWQTKASLDIELLNLLEENNMLPSNTSIMLPLTSFQVKRNIAFERRGYQVLSAGHPYDPVFLFRWANLVSLHENAVTSHIGSHLFFSANLNLNITWLNNSIRDTVKYDSKGSTRSIVFQSAQAVELLYGIRSQSFVDTSLINFFLGIPDNEPCLLDLFRIKLREINLHADGFRNSYRRTWRIR